MGDDANAVGSSRYHLVAAVEKALKRLGTDYIDLFQLHGFDALTPRRGGALHRSTSSSGREKFDYTGVSNFSGWHLMKSQGVAERYGYPRYVAHQVHYSLVGRDYEHELMPLAVDQGVGAIVWSPLGWGRLTGKIRRGQPLPANSRLHKTADKGPPLQDDYVYQVVDALDVIAEETGKTVPQIALNWLLQRPTVCSVIIGARNGQQLLDNLGAVGWDLAAEQVARLETPPAPGLHPTPTGTRPTSPSAIRRPWRDGLRSADFRRLLPPSVGRQGEPAVLSPPAGARQLGMGLYPGFSRASCGQMAEKMGDAGRLGAPRC